MHNTIKIDVAKHYLFVKSCNKSSQDKIFNNSFEEYDLLLNHINQEMINNVYLITRTSRLCYLALNNYLTKQNINVTHIDAIESGLNDQIVKRTNTENLDIRTLNRRLSSIDKIIDREEVRLDGMVRDNRSRSIISMILKSIKNYRQKREKLETIIDNRKTGSGYVH